MPGTLSIAAQLRKLADESLPRVKAAALAEWLRNRATEFEQLADDLDEWAEADRGDRRDAESNAASTVGDLLVELQDAGFPVP